MKYRVTVHGKSFDLDVTEGPEGTLVGGKKAALLGRHGPLAALVREGSSLGVLVEPGLEDGAYFVQLPGGRVLTCHVEDERAQLAHRSLGGAAGERTGPRTVRSVMPGIVVKVSVAPGASVAAKDQLLVVEAMKMQNEIRAETAGVVRKVHVSPGQSIPAGAPLVEIGPA
ncbi:MAG TPA: acetyl-CoA carboxylase biotin carboxyl carrier protein subunit [Planctomycetota bacterium]|nr:acetyl-CoA carboxylase biotin carboxyl carrier protein subunit [Planctomycetota bacterium]